MLQISNTVSIPEHEINLSAVRSALRSSASLSQGAGGQNVNKVSTAIHLRFNIIASSLPERYQECLLKLNDQRLTKEGVIVIKAQEHRSQEQNREEALQRLQDFIKGAIRAVAQANASALPKPRKKSKPTRSSQRKRLNSKTKRSHIKTMRGKITDFSAS